MVPWEKLRTSRGEGPTLYFWHWTGTSIGFGRLLCLNQFLPEIEQKAVVSVPPEKQMSTPCECTKGQLASPSERTTRMGFFGVGKGEGMCRQHLKAGVWSGSNPIGRDTRVKLRGEPIWVREMVFLGPFTDYLLWHICCFLCVLLITLTTAMPIYSLTFLRKPLQKLFLESPGYPPPGLPPCLLPCCHSQHTWPCCSGHETCFFFLGGGVFVSCFLRFYLFVWGRDRAQGRGEAEEKADSPRS